MAVCKAFWRVCLTRRNTRPLFLCSFPKGEYVMPETLLNVHEHSDVDTDGTGDEWYEALPPHEGAAHWLQLFQLGLGVAANAVSLGVLSCGLISRWKKRRAMKGMTDEERMSASNPLYQTLRDIQVSAHEIQADVRQMLARADAISAEQKRQRDADAQVK